MIFIYTVDQMLKILVKEVGQREKDLVRKYIA